MGCVCTTVYSSNIIMIDVSLCRLVFPSSLAVYQTITLLVLGMMSFMDEFTKLLMFCLATDD